MPTLLESGAIVIEKWMPSNKKLLAENQVSLEFLIDHIAERTPSRRGNFPSIKPKNIGYKVLLLKSGTGSGKSTTIPPALYNRFFENLKKNVGITQPTRATTQSIPYDIIKWNRELKMEENIGYQTGEIVKKPVRGIHFMTVGILLQHFKTLTDEEIISKYMFIMIDEVHQRNVDVDSALFLIKKFLERNYENPDCPMIILMSATFEKEIFIEYFDIPKENYIEVRGQTFPKKLYFEKNSLLNWQERAAEIVKEIHTSEEGMKDIGVKDESQNNGDNNSNDQLIVRNDQLIITDKQEKNIGSEVRDIIIFVAINSDGNQLAYKLNMLNLDDEFIKGGYISVVNINSSLFSKKGIEYKNLTLKIENLKTKLPKNNIKKGGGKIPTLKDIEWDDKQFNVVRRIIITTPVLETGMTIHTLKYCIETGFVFNPEFNPVFGVNMLLKKNVTQGSSEQRIGRIGRVAPGVGYYLYTKNTFDLFLKDKHPELLTTEITNTLLSTIISETEAELIETKITDLEGIYMNSNNIKYKISCSKPFNILTLDFLTFPSVDSIQYSLEKLYMLGFISQEKKTTAPYKNIGNGEIYPTTMGFLVNKLRFLSLENIRMIMAGYHYNCNILDLITIAIFIEVEWRTISTKKDRSRSKPINFLNLKNTEEIKLYQKLIVADDFIEYLWIWLLFMEHLKKYTKNNKLDINKINEWAKENQLNYSGLLMVIEQRNIIIESFIDNGFNPFYNGLGLKNGTYNLINIFKKLTLLSCK